MVTTEQYAKAIAYVIKIMNNKGYRRLHDAHDVVHDVYCKYNTLEFTKIRTKLLHGALHGVIHSCGHFSIIGALYFGEMPTNYVYGEYDEKRCTKCKIPKIIILDFRRIVTTRHNTPYTYYQPECKECEGKRKKQYRENANNKCKIQEYGRKFNNTEANQLADRYIKKLILSANKTIKRSEITAQMIALKRQEIIAKRAKQIKKGRSNE